MIADPEKLLRHLIGHPRETEWFEFKVNQFDPDNIGKYISGLANSAMLHNERFGYLVFGVEDVTHKLVGTNVRLKEKRIGTDSFELWLSGLLGPRLHFEFVELIVDDKHVEIIYIDPAYQSPVRFKNEAYVRIDTALKPLRDYPERERALWGITSRFTFEEAIAAPHLSEKDVFELFDVPALLQSWAERL